MKESRKYNRSPEKVAVPFFHHSQLRIARTFTKWHWSLNGKIESQINLFS